MNAASIAKRMTLSIVGGAILLWFHGLVERLTSPLETQAAIAQARDAAPVDRGLLTVALRANLPTIAASVAFLTLLLFVWFIPFGITFGKIGKKEP